MIPFTLQPLSTIEPITPQRLSQGGAAFGQVPVWNGIQYAPLNPVLWIQNNVPQGRISQVNITGSAISSVLGDTATLNILGGGTVNGQPVTNIATGTGITANIVSGTATLSTNAMSFFRVEQVNLGGGLLYTNNILNGSALQFQAGNNVTLSSITNLDGTRIRIDAVSGTAYTHPPYIPLTITPSILGTALNTHTIVTDSIGSVVNALPISIPLPVTSLTHSGLGSPLFTGTSPNFTIKGIRTLTPGTLTINDIGSSLDFSVTIPAGSGVQSLVNGLNTTAVNVGSGVWRIDSSVVSGLVGNNGNGLTVTPNTVTLALATSGNAGAMPALSGNTSTYLRGDGQWATVSSGGINGISINNAGLYTNINFGAGLSVVGNNVTAIGGSSGHTINNSATGVGIVQTAGFATSHTLKGLVAGSNVSITDNGTSITIASTGGGGGFPLEVRKDGITINPSTAILNFKGAGVSVANGVGVEVTIPGSTGGITGIAVNGLGSYSNINFTGAGVSVSANTVTISGGGGGGVTSVNTNPPITNLGTPTAPIIGLAVTGITPGSYGGTNAIPVMTLDSWGRVTAIGTVPPSGGGGGVTSFNTLTGAITLQNGTNTTVQSLGGGVFQINATGGGGGTITTVNTNTTSLTGNVVGSTLNLNLSGQTQSFANSYNSTTRQLTVTHYITDTGLVTGTVQQTFTMPQGLPNSASLGDMVFYNGVSWERMDFLVHDSMNNSIRHRFGFSNSGVVFFPSTTLVQNDNATLQGFQQANVQGANTNIALSNPSTGVIYLNAGTGVRETGSETVPGAISVGNSGVKIGFFGKFPIVRPTVTSGNLASLQTALANLGLINLV